MFLRVKLLMVLTMNFLIRLAAMGKFGGGISKPAGSLGPGGVRYYPDASLGAREGNLLEALLRRSLIDAGFATYKAKDHYNRQRPFAQLGETTCAPKEEAQLSKDGSYPSGHAALGWAWGLILTGVAPDKADALTILLHAVRLNLSQPPSATNIGVRDNRQGSGKQRISSIYRNEPPL